MGKQPQICGVLSSFAPSFLPRGLQGRTWGTLRVFAVYFQLLGQLSPALTCVLGQTLHHFPQPNFKPVSPLLWFRDPAHQALSENLHFVHSQHNLILSLPSAGGCGILVRPGLTLLAAESPGPQPVPGTGLARTGSAWMGTAGPDLGWWQPEPSQGPGKRDSWRGRAGAAIPWDLRGPRALLACETGCPR